MESLNAASFAPFTTSAAPGEFITLYGSNLAASITAASSVSYPTSLGGVSVSINRLLAPVYKVTPGRVDMIVPSTPWILRIMQRSRGTIAEPLPTQ